MIRRYTKEDIVSIIDLEEKVLGTSLGYEMLEQDLSNPFSYTFVYEQDGKIAGYISTVFDGFTVEILNFCILSSLQNKGIGTYVLSGVLDDLHHLGSSSVILDVRFSNERAIHVYKKLGFHQIRIRKEYYQNKEDAIVMQKLYDEKKDMIHLEAILFSKKEGDKYVSDFKERYALNYYDLYDKKITSLKDYKYEDYILFQSNWIDEKLFEGFDISSVAFMHVNAYQYKSLKSKEYEIHLNDLFDYLDYKYQDNVQYGEDYAKKYAEFSYKNICNHKSKFFSVVLDMQTVGSVTVFEYYHSIYIFALHVKEEYRHQGIAACLLDKVIAYAKEIGKVEVYLEAETDDTPIQMYERMNFKTMEVLYEMLKVK